MASESQNISSIDPEASSSPAEHSADQGARPRQPHPGRELSSLWYALMIRPWTTLGVVCPDDPQRAWRLVQTLVQTSGLPPESIRAVSVLDASAERAAAISHAVNPKKVKASGQRVVLATDSPLVNPVAIRVLGSCDAVLLLVDQGRSVIPDARRTLDLIGPERVLGAVFVQE